MQSTLLSCTKDQELVLEFLPNILNKLVIPFPHTINNNTLTCSITLINELEKVLTPFVQKMQFTHYFSFNFEGIEPVFINFTKLVPSNLKQYLTKPAHLHVTLFLVKLFLVNQVTEIQDYLENIPSSGQEIEIDIENIKGFSPKKSSSMNLRNVLFFEYKPNQVLADIRNKFITDLGNKYEGNFTDPYVSHITIMNSKFGNKKPFNPTAFLSQYGNYKLGTFKVKAINFVARNPTLILKKIDI